MEATLKKQKRTEQEAEEKENNTTKQEFLLYAFATNDTTTQLYLLPWELFADEPHMIAYLEEHPSICSDDDVDRADVPTRKALQKTIQKYLDKHEDTSIYSVRKLARDH